MLKALADNEQISTIPPSGEIEVDLNVVEQMGNFTLVSFKRGISFPSPLAKYKVQSAKSLFRDKVSPFCWSSPPLAPLIGILKYAGAHWCTWAESSRGTAKINYFA